MVIIVIVKAKNISYTRYTALPKGLKSITRHIITYRTPLTRMYPNGIVQREPGRRERARERERDREREGGCT